MDVPQDNGFNMGPCGKNINIFISETINLIGSILYLSFGDDVCSQ
jgi:hypothetical protein